MIHTWRIGDATVASLVEYVGPTHAPEATFPAFNLDTFRKRGAELQPGAWYPRISRFTIEIQIWILKRGNDVVIIDTGVGNHKVRPPARMHMLIR